MLGVLGALAVASVPWSLDPERVAQRLNEAAPMHDGARWQVPAEATFTLFPRPMVDVVDLRLVDASGQETLNVPAAAIALSTLGLMGGDVEITEARLRNANATLDLDVLRGRLARFRPVWNKLIIKGGRARVISRRLGIDGKLAPFSGTLTWSDAPQTLNIAITGLWNDRIVRAEAEFGDPQSLAAGGAGRVELSCSSADSALKFRGRVDPLADPRLAGDITLDSVSLDSVAARLGLPTSNPSSTFPFSLTGQLGAGADSINFAEATLKLGGQRLEGSLGFFRTDGHWTASANLATDNLDLAALIGKPPALVGDDGDWSRTPPKLMLDPALDLDLRVSAGRFGWGPIVLADAAFDMSRRNGDWKLRVLDGAVGGGALSGELAVTGCAELCRGRLHATLAHADLRQALQPIGVTALSGRGAFEIDATATGNTPEAIVASANGEASLTAQNGAIAGSSFEEALRRSQHRPFDAARDLSSGETPFSAVHARLTVQNGVASLADAHLVGPGAIVDGSGEIDLAHMGWGLRFEAQQADVKGAPSAGAARLTLDLAGPWFAPTIGVAAPAP